MLNVASIIHDKISIFSYHIIQGGGGGGGGGGQKSVHIRWVFYHCSVLYLRLVTLQIIYCNYSLEALKPNVI